MDAALSLRSEPQPVLAVPELIVTDIRQYLYCPRIVYYRYVLPVEKVRSFAMQAGEEDHLRLEYLEGRRRLSKYRLDEGERRFRVRLRSERLKLSGVLDMLIVSGRECYPVEFKSTPGRIRAGHKYQLVAYAMLVEEKIGRPIRMGFLMRNPGRRLDAVPITDAARLHVRRLISAIRRIIREARMPLPTSSRGRCVDCEFRNYCLDIGFGAPVAFAENRNGERRLYRGDREEGAADVLSQ